jgi:predicted PurR-regulated permease PerM
LKFPFYAKASFFFIGVFAFISMLYIGRAIILPLIFAIIIAIVLHPVVNLLTRFKINRVVAIIITLVVSPQKILAWIAKTKSELINTSGSSIGNTIVNVGNGLVVILLIPVYIFMILFYQPLLIEFFRRIFGADHRTEMNLIITQIKVVIQSYLTGLFIEFVLVAALDTTALLILGIDYVILLGIIGALLNIIPYLGGLVAVALPMMIALVIKDSTLYPLYVLAAYYFIQLIDNNFIVPVLVASKVKINALVSIIVVLAFGALWGIPGMFISIPLTAIAKLIFDNVEPLKPWGFLLGDTMPPILKIKLILKKVKNKSV